MLAKCIVFPTIVYRIMKTVHLFMRLVVLLQRTQKPCIVQVHNTSNRLTILQSNPNMLPTVFVLQLTRTKWRPRNSCESTYKIVSI